MQPNKHLHHGETEKKSGKQPTIECSLNRIKFSGVKHSVGKVIPHTSLGWQKAPCEFGRTFYTLILQTLMYELHPQLGYV